MPKINNYLLALIGAALALMVFITLYDVLLRPSEEPSESAVVPLNTYFGEDVLQFIKQK